MNAKILVSQYLIFSTFTYFNQGSNRNETLGVFEIRFYSSIKLYNVASHKDRSTRRISAATRHNKSYSEVKLKFKTGVMYKTIFVINIICPCLQNSNVLCILNCCLPIFKGQNLLPKRVCSLGYFESAPKRSCSLIIFCKLVLT